MSEDFENDLSDDQSQEFEEAASDEDTEDASETDMLKYEGEYTEIKEQMYQDKLATLKEQLNQLDTNIHPEYVRRVKKIEQVYQERILLNEAILSYDMDRIEKEFLEEQRATEAEFEDRKVELKENLIADLEERKRAIEMERSSLELTSDTYEPKPPTTRKLRRRPNDPIPIPEKRKRGSPAQLNQLLEESEILDDIKAITKAHAHKYANENPSDSDTSQTVTEARIEEGKLFYDKKWYHRGQTVLVRSREGFEFSGNLASINNSEMWVRKTNDGTKVKLLLSHLQKGKFTLHRRAA
ncbi:Sin3 histone deacetylase corepressor complex component SDS3 [Halotydeus destructor]|nr:Sin3 histone deacetylase corepressor complex component SDS3 [Halotydeus destructor]